MRGDLQQISLSDIIQTLSMSKMEGILRVCNPVEQRAVYCQGGYVQDLVFGRPAHRRLGERLVNAGLLAAADLRTALHEQKKEQRPLGEILVGRGVITREEIEDIATNQIVEDLYALFTWRHGSFEFYKGRPTDETVLERLQTLPRFEANSVLLDVARRADEWETILDTFASVDEILTCTVNGGPDELGAEHASVLKLIDGHRSIREVTGLTLLGLFDCARICRDLVNGNWAVTATIEQVLAVAASYTADDDSRRALVALRTVADRDEILDIETAKEVATAMEQAGDLRLAARCLWESAEVAPNADAIELLRESCRLDTRSSYPLTALQQRLVDAGDEGDELLDITSRLADSLIDEGSEDQALSQIELLESMTADRSAVLGRKARILQRLGQRDEAIDQLEELAELLRTARDLDRVATVYEQILALDGKRRDIAKSLASLKRSNRAARVRQVALAGIPILICVGLWLGYEGWNQSHRLDRILSELRGSIERGDLEQVPTRLDDAAAAFGQLHPEIETLRALLDQKRNEQQAAGIRKLEQAMRTKLADAGETLDSGEVGTALTTYHGLLRDEQFAGLVLESGRARVANLATRLSRLANDLPHQLPEAVKPSDTAETRTEVLTSLDETFHEADLRVAKAVLGQLTNPTLAQLADADRLHDIGEHARAIRQTFSEANRRRDEYLASQRSADTKTRLQPVFEAAQKHAKAHQFEAAAEAYAKLVAEYPGDADLQTHFESQAERFGKIVATLRELEVATDNGDHAAAERILARLSEREPKIPFDKLAELPLRIVTTPSGARVSINEQDVGRTPLLHSYLRGESTRVRVNLDGYHALETELRPGFNGQLETVLARIPAWATTVAGSVQQPPTMDGAGRAIIVDRSGVITALDANSGDTIWIERTDDLSGLLSRPVLSEDNLYLASFDGELRCLEAATSEPLWTRSGIAAEAAPCLVGANLIVATSAGRVLILHASTGEERATAQLPGEAHLDLIATRAHAFVATDNGYVTCFDPRDASVVWQKRVGESLRAAPTLAENTLYCVSEDGNVLALDTKDGSERWRRGGLGQLELRPAVVGNQLIVATATVVRSFRLTDGRSGPQFSGHQPWSSAPSKAGGSLFIGDRSGTVYALDPSTLACRYVIQGTSPLSAPITVDAKGRALAIFEDRTIQGFSTLP